MAWLDCFVGGRLDCECLVLEWDKDADGGWM